MTTLAVLPISRTQFLDRVIKSINSQEIMPSKLVASFQGSLEDFMIARKKLSKLTIPYTIMHDISIQPGRTIPERRLGIIKAHDYIRNYIDTKYDTVFLIEDDGVLPHNALSNLLYDMDNLPNPGIISGFEIGRWGMPYVGVWRADDVYRTREIHTLKKGSNVEPIDACGLYCCVMSMKTYLNYDFFADNGLGPDVNFCLTLRNLSYCNYVDWRVGVEHLTIKNGKTVSIPHTTDTVQISLKKHDMAWDFNILT